MTAPLKEAGCVQFVRGLEGFEVRGERVRVWFKGGGEDWCDV